MDMSDEQVGAIGDGEREIRPRHSRRRLHGCGAEGSQAPQKPKYYSSGDQRRGHGAQHEILMGENLVAYPENHM